MQDKESIIIKPNIPWYFLGLAFLFLSLSVFLFSSKHFDTPMGILATCFIGISLLICWMIDKGYMNVEITSDKIKRLFFPSEN